MGLCVGLGVGLGVGLCVGRCDGRSVGDRVGVGGLVGLGVVGLRGNATYDASLTTITTGKSVIRWNENPPIVPSRKYRAQVAASIESTFTRGVSLTPAVV